jgi:hypothetical protein
VTRLVVDYRDFSRNEAQGNSPTYARLALAVAASETLLSLIDQVAGDLNERLVELAESAPTDATLVVLHSAVLAYLSSPERDEFVAQVQGLRGHWISNEAPHVIDEIASRAPARRRTPGHPFLTALDGHPVAWSGPHGQSIELIPSMRAT